MNIKVIHEPGAPVREYTPEEFKHSMGMEYLPHLEFKNDRVLKKAQRLVKRANEMEEIETRQKWLGAFYAQEIQRGSIPDLTIAWINFDIGYGVIANCDLPK
ncbi:MAG TPA: hypothetical protein VLG49_01245, partial [Rhabdochlamydiaceae bacterium]|nr:hypothetical protein [Rhabdochlamydiaceae bacterium]